MSRDLNKVMLIGRVGNNPVYDVTSSGFGICRFRLATNMIYRNSSTDAIITRTEWHRVVSFNTNAESIYNLLKQGDLIYVEGRIHYGRYNKKLGAETAFMKSVDIIINGVSLLKRKADCDPIEEPSELDIITEDEEDEDLPF